MHRAAAMPRARTLPRPSRAVVWAVALLALVIAGGLWLRDSSLVAVNRVTVTGLTGPQAAKISGQLEAAARDMTTLHVRGDQLRAVTEPYPVVKDVRVSTDFPHGLKIDVVENTPVAAISVNGSKTPVSADGKIIRGASQSDLPIVPLKVAPTGATVADATARHAIAALAAAPEALRARGHARVDDARRRPHPRTSRRPGPALRRRRSPRRQVGRGRRGAVLRAVRGRHLPRPPLPRAACRRGPGGPDDATRSGSRELGGSHVNHGVAADDGAGHAIANLNLSLSLRNALRLKDKSRLLQTASKIAL